MEEETHNCGDCKHYEETGKYTGECYAGYKRTWEKTCKGFEKEVG